MTLLGSYMHFVLRSALPILLFFVTLSCGVQCTFIIFLLDWKSLLSHNVEFLTLAESNDHHIVGTLDSCNLGPQSVMLGKVPSL